MLRPMIMARTAAVSALLSVAVLSAGCSARRSPAASPASAVAGPRIIIGSVRGTPMSAVRVPISLASGGVEAIVVGPLELAYPPAALKFLGCSRAVPPEFRVDSVSLHPGSVRLIVDSVENRVIPDGPLATCLFAIAPQAPRGPAPLTFQGSGMSDVEFHDLDVRGENGAVQVVLPSELRPGAAPAAPPAPFHHP